MTRERRLLEWAVEDSSDLLAELREYVSADQQNAIDIQLATNGQALGLNATFAPERILDKDIVL